MRMQPFECIDAIVKFGSFTRAADHLYITQSTLSRRIAQMEADLGFQLFKRNPLAANVQLTPAGQHYYEVLTQAARLLDEAEDQARAIASGRTAALRIGMLIDASEMLMEQATYQFRRDWPDVRLSFNQYTHKELEVALVEREIDIAFINSQSHLPDQEYGRLLLEKSPLCVVVSVEHPWHDRSSASVAELKGRRLMLLSAAVTPYDVQLGSLCKAAGFEPHIVKTCRVVTELLNYVSVGEGIGIASGRMARLSNSRLRFIPLKEAEEIRHYACWHKNASTPQLKNYIAELKKLVPLQ